MPEQIFAEQIFDKHAAANGLPSRTSDETLNDYVTRVGGELIELPRRLTLAVQAARVADHTDCALWCAQAKQELPVKR